jgi:transcriptional regulator with XRE-family HTH domain
MATAIIDAAQLRYELARRNLTQRDLAHLAGLPEMTVSRAINGRPVVPATLRRIAEALDRTPVGRGADLVLVRPEKPAPEAQ